MNRAAPRLRQMARHIREQVPGARHENRAVVVRRVPGTGSAQSGTTNELPIRSALGV